MAANAFGKLPVATLLLSVAMASCGRSPGGVTVGGVYPVSAEMLTDASFSHRTGREDPPLKWTFSETTTEMKSQEGPLPRDLLDAFLAGTAEAREITAQWRLEDGSLVLSNIRADGEPMPGERKARIFFTGVIRVQTEEHQYVFNRHGG